MKKDICRALRALACADDSSAVCCAESYQNIETLQGKAERSYFSLQIITGDKKGEYLYRYGRHHPEVE